MKEYHNLLKTILVNGIKKENRTGVNTISIFGHQMRIDLSKGFPLLTTKKMHIRSIIYELLWILKGRTDNQYLNENRVTIWDEWATEEQTAKFGRKEGDLGPIYGHQFRNYGATKTNGSYNKDGVDQIQKVIDEIKTNPNSRRLIVNSWNPKEVDEVTLPPCHTLFQFNVSNGLLSTQLYQRSADAFLGVPFNIASYALLTMIIAKLTNLKVGEFIHTFGDLHIYENHLDQVNLQLSRAPYRLPKMIISSIRSIDDLEYDSFKLVNYTSHSRIPADVAI